MIKQNLKSKSRYSKIYKVFNIIIDNIPAWYHYPIKVYSRIYDLLRADAKEENMTYEDLIRSYREYFKQNEHKLIDN